MIVSVEILYFSTIQNNIENDGYANDWSDGVDWYHTMVATHAQKRAKQGDVGSCKDSDRYETAVVACGEHKSGNVWHHQSEETNRTALGTHHGREQPRHREQGDACAVGVHA